MRSNLARFIGSVLPALAHGVAAADGADPSVGPLKWPPAGKDTSTVTSASGVAIPNGWQRKLSHQFGRHGNVRDAETLAEHYYEGQYYNRDEAGRLLLPNVVINQEQQTYQRFENADVFAFKDDRLTIQGRGKPDGTIESGEIVSRHVARSWCVEARYTIPSSAKSWPAFWQYAWIEEGNIGSEVDFEQPISPKQDVSDVSMYNHGLPESEVKVHDARFRTGNMTWSDRRFDGSTAPHWYMSCYDDETATLARFIDGRPIYTARWKWVGPEATTIVNLAVGGKWPGNHPDPGSYVGDLDLYSIDYYGP